MVKIVILDFDDTLIKSVESAYRISCLIAKKLKFKKPDKEFYFSLWGKHFKEIISAIFPNCDFDEYLKLHVEIEDANPLELFNDTEKVIKSLAAKEYLLGILSSRDKKSGENHCKRTGIYGYFGYLQFAEANGYRKPDPKVFDGVLAHFKVRPDEIVYVGDCIGDFKAAREAGLEFIAVTTGINTSKDFEEAGCKNIINRLHKLEKCLKNWDRK